MTPFTIARDKMLPMIGILSFDPAVNATTAGKRAVEPFDIAFCADCMTGAAEEIFDEGPASVSEAPDAYQLYPPTGVTLTVTQFSKTISGLTTWAPWMLGCTINISGDQLFNEITSQTTLLRPYAGGSGAVSGTVYGDAVKLPSNVKQVMDPVRLPTLAPLMGTTNRERFLGYTNPHRYGNRMTTGRQVFYDLTNKTVGQPAIWMAENMINVATAETTKFLRFNPMPNQAYSATVRVKIKAPTFTAADIYAGADYTTDPGAIIPLDYHSSIFVPFAMQRFMAHPSFNNPIAAKEIVRQYQRAQMMLNNCTPGVVSNEPAGYQ